MQFTGLKDKNGNEIYEGDIVSFMGNNLAVVWNSALCGFCLRNKPGIADGSGIQTFMPEPNDFLGATPEVIGNIYENPKVL